MKDRKSTPVSFAGGRGGYGVRPSSLVDMTTRGVDELVALDRARSGGAKPAVRVTFTNSHTGKEMEIYVRR